MTKRSGNKEPDKNQTGSPMTGEPFSIAVGRIRRPHGVKGEVIFEPFPEYPVHLKKGKVILVGKKQEPFSIRSIRRMDQNYLLSFDGMDDCDVVSHLRNQQVLLPASELKDRPDGGNYPHQVLGMTVIDEKDKVIGILEEVLLTGANDVYVVSTTEGQEVLLPAIKSVILKVDAEKRIMIVRLPEWE